MQNLEAIQLPVVTTTTMPTGYKNVNRRYVIKPRADLSNADLIDTDLTNANLTDANLHGADLSNADLTEAKLDNVTWPKGWKLVRDE